MTALMTTLTSTTALKPYVPSTQQQAFFDWIDRGTGSAIMIAVAGAGKTTTLVEGIRRMRGFVLVMAYNKKAGKELKDKLSATGIDTTKIMAGTVHSAGYKAWTKLYKACKINDRKVQDIMKDLNVPENFRAFVQKSVSMAKQRAIGVLCRLNSPTDWLDLVNHYELDELLTQDMDDDELSIVDLEDLLKQGLQWSARVLKRSIQLDPEVIDYDDMVYAPLVHGIKTWTFDWVLIDEAQDTNPARRALAKKFLKPGGRLVAVGDPAQAIYGFTGADNDSLDVIKAEFGCQELPLTVTYRCPKSVVALAQTWVNHIVAHDTAPEGIVRGIDHKALLDVQDFGPNDAILCRNTKPLVDIAYSLIRKGIGCHVEGKDIGNGLSKLATKWKSAKLVGQLTAKLDDYLDKQVSKYLAKGQEVQADLLVDRVETLRVILAQFSDDEPVKTVVAHIQGMFKDGDEDDHTVKTVTLSTIHRSKGREWTRVFLYGRAKFMPSKFARQDWQLAQETNLMYVGVTRAKHELIEVAAL